MKRIYLFCDQGMSTSMLASKMQKIADEHKLPIEVKAFTYKKIGEIVEEFHPDVILLGPQVKYLYDSVKDRFKDVDVFIEVIDAQDYGMMDGEKVLKKAIRLIKSK